jgi:hypothetical protein
MTSFKQGYLEIDLISRIKTKKKHKFYFSPKQDLGFHFFCGTETKTEIVFSFFKEQKLKTFHKNQEPPNTNIYLVMTKELIKAQM